jgi:steroid 5-alpha reductase family enzyme
MYYDVHASVWHQMLALSIYIFGIFLHFSSDIHKFVVLELQKGLITEGLWAYSRNINYFGELLIYSSFSSLARSWVPMAYLLLFICVYWLQNMLRKDKSLSRYKGFEQYKRSTRLFIPYIL